ncbi:Predicted transporter (major facilitator superfamily) [Plasmopara halstedii]|uniref:Predicted transporter (Major facilitator superfamily) n=1 Tax=Plasmopara halstedii TaxID=4781 RepID=A0A0P1B687_PLAHL|nr:Predicted transporter (major facilitator superfamily) [Plasmopara halstedii]CEG49929.1 Predicted transporter (major facilitator superfamily) [Plasmopara halstedii]|eukprot:XP_024586298.1 Predicted transporter (major facilitator superfamily) [Plasmopara halstedii]
MRCTDVRLDSLEPRLSGFYLKLLLFTGVSWAIQAAELVLLFFTRVLVTQDIKIGTPVLEMFEVSILVGSAFGGLIFGQIADKLGRRVALITSMVFSSAGFAILAYANVSDILLLGRVIIGLGFGGQLVSTFLLVFELTPSSMTSRMIAFINAFTGLGGLLGLALAYVVAPKLQWRSTYFGTSGLVLYTFVLHFMVPESPRWLASVGRTDEACAIVEKMEQSCGQVEALQSTSVQDFPALETKLSRIQELQRLNSTLILGIMWITMTVSTYILGIYIPTLISLNGYNMFASWTTTSLLEIAQVVGSITGATVLDTYGPSRCFVIFAILAATLSIWLSYMPWSCIVVIFFSFFVTAFLSVCWSCVLLYTPLHMKVMYRGRGMGYAIGVSRLAAVGGQFIYPYMFNTWMLSVSMICWIFGGLLIVVAVLIHIVSHINYHPLSQEDDAISLTEREEIWRTN